MAHSGQSRDNDARLLREELERMGGRLEGLKKEPAPYVAYFAKRTPFCNVLGVPNRILRILVSILKSPCLGTLPNPNSV